MAKKVPAKLAANNRPEILVRLDEGRLPRHPVNARSRRGSAPEQRPELMLNIRLRDSEATDRQRGRFEPHDTRFRSAPTPTPRGKR